MPCQCHHGKDPAFLARDEMLTDRMLEIYAELVNPDWTSDDCDPEELVEACDAIKAHWGNAPCGDYAEACDWAAFYTSEKALDAGDLDGIGQRETDREMASQRGESQDEDEEEDEDYRNALEEDAHEQDRDARDDEECPVLCLDSFRDGEGEG